MNTPSQFARAPFALGDVRVEPDRNALFAGGEILRIEPKVMDVLVALASAGGEVVSRETLIGRVWAIDFGGDESVSRAVSLLRKALKEAGLGEDAIETVPKRGYRLTIPAGEPQESPPTENAAPAGTAPAIAKPEVRKFPLRAAIVGAAAAAFAAIGVFLFHWAGGSTPPEQPVVAVLPFDDLSPKGDYAWFAEGLADELIDNLARVPRVVVIGRTSSFRYGHTKLSARAIGEQLGARYLIEGGVRRDGANLRISARMIDTTKQTSVWSETYDRRNEDVFAVQTELARAIVGALNIRMAAGAPRQMIRTSSTQAFDAFLMGRAYLRAEGAENILRASDEFRRAVALDPKYMDAWYGLYGALSVYDFWHPDRLKAANAEIDAAVSTLERLAPNDSGLKIAKAWRMANRGDIIGADRAFRRIFFGQNARGCTDIAFVETLLYGRLARGADEYAACLAVFRKEDPFDLSTAENNTYFAHMLGRDDIALAEYERSKSIPGGPGTGEIYAFLRAFKAGDRDEARARFRAMIDFLPPKVTQFEAVYENFGDDARVLDLLNAARVDPANQDPTRLVMIAKLLAIFGDPAHAADALKRHFLDAGGTWWQELWMPEHAATRRAAAFRDIIREKGFERFFRKSGKWNNFCRPTSETDFECF